ncbi:hypothetical protein CI610_01026 [invertebrate metagenome]|uniref:Ectoine dioxygenase n=1 Tax=invertebrate metagenome TaxID=1711999 RepID=A0A2H9T9U1_9ZZZZ
MFLRWIIVAAVLFALPVIGSGLTAEQTDFYQQQGYLIIKSLFTPAEVAKFIGQAEQATQYAQKLIEQQSQPQGQWLKDIKVMDNGSQYVFDGHNQAIKRIVWVGASYPVLLAVGRDSRLTVPVSQLLQVASLIHLINQLHPKHSGDGVAFGCHRDVENRLSFDPAWQGQSMVNGGFVQTFLALDPAHSGNGGIEIYSGSHNSEEPLKSMLDQQQCQAALEESYGASISPELEPGDVIFFHPNVAHFSRANKSSSSRRALINGYASPGANHSVYPGTGSGETIFP